MLLERGTTVAWPLKELLSVHPSHHKKDTKTFITLGDPAPYFFNMPNKKLVHDKKPYTFEVLWNTAFLKTPFLSNKGQNKKQTESVAPNLFAKR